MRINILIPIIFLSSLVNAGVKVNNNGRIAGNNSDHATWELNSKIEKRVELKQRQDDLIDGRILLQKEDRILKREKTILYQLKIDEAKNAVRFQEAKAVPDGKWIVRTFEGKATNLTPNMKEALEKSAKLKQWQEVQLRE